MAANAALYTANTQPPQPNLLRALAPGATVTDNGGLLRPPTQFQVQFDDARVTLSAMPAAELGRHLVGFRGYLSRCELSDPNLLDRLAEVKACWGVVVEPDHDAGGKTALLIEGLAGAMDALVFRDGCVFDGRKRVAAPLTAPPASDPGEGDDDLVDVEMKPPAPERVARRLVVLTAMSLRGILDLVESIPERASRLEKVRAFVRRNGAWGELEPQERLALEAPLGGLDQRTRIDSSWRAEGAAVLAWALRAAELPPHDEQFDIGSLALRLGVESLDRTPLLAKPELRPVDELEWMAGRLLGLHWRLRDFSLRPRAMDFRAFSLKCWFGSFDLTGIAVAGDDLAIGGAPISKAEQRQIVVATSIAGERHLAINWLAGLGEIYSEVDTST